jgi:hypothetical protein
MADLHLPSTLTPLFAGLPRRMDVDAATVGEAIERLDELVREERTAFMTVAVHARWSGQAARAAAVRAFLEHAHGLGGVRFMRRLDVARWWLETYPT